MAVLRILLMVEDSPSVVVSAVTMSSAPTAAPDLPVGFVLDPSFPAVPIERPAVQQTLFAMSAGIGAGKVNNIGPRAYLVRGLIDEALLDQAIRQTTQADGATRIFADPEISAMPTCGGTPPVGTALDVKRLLGAGRLVQEKMDGRDVALAIVDTGINLSYLQAKGLQPSLDVHASWTSSAAIIPGQGVVDHGTMCAYDALLTAPNALLFDYAVLSGTTTGGSIMSGVLSNAVSAYGKLLQLMTLSPDERHFHSMVVSNSWGVFKQSWDFPPGNPGRYLDNLRHPFNIIVSSLANAGADILFAAGNCGPTCPDGRCDVPPPPEIFLANSHEDVMCVAGVDTAGAVVGYSSLGPGILGNQKPDLAAYTHFLGSEVFGRGKPDSGTSAACPVLAGVVSALRSVYAYDPAVPKRAPSAVRNFLRTTAKGSGAWRNDWGYGIVDSGGFPTAATVL